MQSKDITAEQAIKVSIFGVHGVFSLIHNLRTVYAAFT